MKTLFSKFSLLLSTLVLLCLSIPSEANATPREHDVNQYRRLALKRGGQGAINPPALSDIQKIIASLDFKKDREETEKAVAILASCPYPEVYNAALDFLREHRPSSVALLEDLATSMTHSHSLGQMRGISKLLWELHFPEASIERQGGRLRAFLETEMNMPPKLIGDQQKHRMVAFAQMHFIAERIDNLISNAFQMLETEHEDQSRFAKELLEVIFATFPDSQNYYRPLVFALQFQNKRLFKQVHTSYFNAVAKEPTLSVPEQFEVNHFEHQALELKKGLPSPERENAIEGLVYLVEHYPLANVTANALLAAAQSKDPETLRAVALIHIRLSDAFYEAHPTVGGIIKRKAVDHLDAGRISFREIMDCQTQIHRAGMRDILKMLTQK